MQQHKPTSEGIWYVCTKTMMLLNLIGNRTDRSYTNGSRIDFFYESRLKKDGFFYRVLPIAGDSSTNVSGWSVAQIMVTPQDLSKVEYQPNDYPYAGSLFVTRSFYSYNPKKKFSYQTELLVGIRGRHALAKQTQIAIHVCNQRRRTAWLGQPAEHAAFNQFVVHRGEKPAFMEEHCGVERRHTNPCRLPDGCRTCISCAAHRKNVTIL